MMKVGTVRVGAYMWGAGATFLSRRVRMTCLRMAGLCGGAVPIAAVAVVAFLSELLSELFRVGELRVVRNVCHAARSVQVNLFDSGQGPKASLYVRILGAAVGIFNVHLCHRELGVRPVSVRFMLLGVVIAQWFLPRLLGRFS